MPRGENSNVYIEQERIIQLYYLVMVMSLSDGEGDCGVAGFGRYVSCESTMRAIVVVNPGGATMTPAMYIIAAS